MRAIALLGSPRKLGNSDILAEEVLNGARSVGLSGEKVYLDDHHIRPIAEVADNTCQRDDPRADDDFPAVMDRFLAADLVVLATPVYWAGVSGQLKCFFDRLSSYFNREPYAQRFTGKGYVAVTTFGRKEPDHGRWVVEPLKHCVEVLRGTYLGDVCVSVYEKAMVTEMPDTLQAARDLGRRAAEALISEENGRVGEGASRRALLAPALEDTMAKSVKASKKDAAAPSPLREIVGDAVYDVWVAMLSELVPDGRTHRLSVLVASMLSYASSAAWSDEGDIDEDSPAYPFLAVSEGVDDEGAYRLLKPMLVRLFKDAGVKHGRVSSRGQRYSIIEDAVIEFFRWYDYPWEG